MIRRNKMCESCIFRGISDRDRLLLAAMPAEEIWCHSEWPAEDIQCRGHWEAARRIFGSKT
jgi:hypothetical protein